MYDYFKQQKEYIMKGLLKARIMETMKPAQQICTR